MLPAQFYLTYLINKTDRLIDFPATVTETETETAAETETETERETDGDRDRDSGRWAVCAYLRGGLVYGNDVFDALLRRRRPAGCRVCCGGVHPQPADGNRTVSGQG